MKAYLQMFLWMMLFVMIIELIFPDSNYRKYLKLVLGCILVYTMLSPITGVLPEAGQTYEDYVTYYKEKFMGTESITTYEDEVAMQTKQLKTFYEKSIQSLVEKEFKTISVKSAFVSYGKEEGETVIDRIDLVIAPKEEQAGTFHVGAKSDSLAGDEENLKNKIKTCLENFYNVKVCNIYITVQKN